MPLYIEFLFISAHAIRLTACLRLQLYRIAAATVFYVGAGTGESLLKNMLDNDTVANALASPAVPLILDPAEVSSGTANYGFNFPRTTALDCVTTGSSFRI